MNSQIEKAHKIPSYVPLLNPLIKTILRLRARAKAVVAETVSIRPSPLKLSRRKGALIVIGIFIAILMGGLDQFVVLTALPTITTDLSQPSGVAFVLAAYLISGTIGIPIFGRLSDIFSRRSVFLLGLATFIAGSAA
jgi:predicted MFS family arabinose efflux permease